MNLHIQTYSCVKTQAGHFRNAPVFIFVVGVITKSDYLSNLTMWHFAGFANKYNCFYVFI